MVVALVSCRSLTPPEVSPPAIHVFKSYITGDFDNRQQVEAERAAGKQVHPLARHVNRVADHRIRNAPQRAGFWLIEESYYDMPDGTHKINHHLFFFEAVDARTVRLYAYQLPDYLPMEQLTNDNPNLSIDYHDLRISPRFKPAEYAFDGKDTFTIHAPNDWGNGMQFTLIEKFTPGRLEVMELLEKNGQRLTPYDTPIIYLKTQ
ncbi:MAG: hypothetical protein RMJ33_00055 [Saprospiraceae bacterium]|nr:hypothetical protein [Saprospiraceae bacterium]MDW8228201.1 hypothetical protein [Saprospiraceae bacterium]